MSWMSEVAMMMDDVEAVLGQGWVRSDQEYSFKLGSFSIDITRHDDRLVYSMTRPDRVAKAATEDCTEARDWAHYLGLPVQRVEVAA